MASICIQKADFNDSFKKFAIAEDRIFHRTTYTYMDVNQRDQRVIDFLARTMIEIYEPRMLRHILMRNYCYTEEEEIEAILKYARFISNQEDMADGEEVFNRKIAWVKERLTEYFKESSILHLEGFYRFRLKEEWQRSHELIENAIDEYMLEKEYREYIRQLKGVVLEREERASLMHLVQLQNGQFQLYDQHGNPLPEEYGPSLASRYHNLEQEQDDLILSRLVTLNPNIILLHCKDESHPVVITIQNIYEGKVELCQGCALCNTSSKIKDSSY